MALMKRSEYERIFANNEQGPFLCTLNKHIDSGSSFDLYWHEEMEIKLIVSGAVNINMGSKVIRADEGDIVIINPCEYHANQKVGESDVVYHLLCVDLVRIFQDSFFSQFALPYRNDEIRYKNVIKNDDIKKLAEEMFASFNENNPLKTLGTFITFFSSLKDYEDNDEKHLKKDKSFLRQEEIVNTALGYIHGHYNENLRLGDISSKCCMTSAHFCRVFRTFTGESPMHYINKLRINKAITLLSNSNLNIKEIASLVGFEDNAYFSRCFKRYTGMSPTEYMATRN